MTLNNTNAFVCNITTYCAIRAQQISQRIHALDRTPGLIPAFSRSLKLVQFYYIEDEHQHSTKLRGKDAQCEESVSHADITSHPQLKCAEILYRCGKTISHKKIQAVHIITPPRSGDIEAIRLRNPQVNYCTSPIGMTIHLT